MKPTKIDRETCFQELAEDLPEIEKRGLRAGKNLRLIQEKQWWKPDYKSFEALLEVQFGFSRSRAYQLIGYSEVVESLSPRDAKHITNENQARALAEVPEEYRAEVISEVIEINDGEVTASQITETAKTVVQAPKDIRPKDRTGWPIPEPRLDLFRRAKAVEEFIDKLNSVRGYVRRMQEANGDVMYRECHPNEMLINLDNLISDLKLAIPFAVCPICQGIKVDTCKACSGRGVLSKFRWDNTVPDEMKLIRQKAMEDK